jgi:ABC-2 type transport system ATP-binding protein
MITVDKLTKDYGPTHALRGVSFDVRRGDVVGFLGPNGAGKSTTMKILTGYLLPTSGTATVDGLDVVDRSLEVRRRIGYLPESTPLYTEMRVDDYLRFVAEIRGVPSSNVRGAVSRVVDLCGLQKVVGKNILELSKGYRQRVGLAQAMVHSPDVLILDEPTSGLDPNQIIEVRGLIKRLGEQHTVILSTHYLQEVEASATRIIIVSQGEIVADDTRDRLVAQLPSGVVLARLRGPAANVQRQLQELLAGCTITEIDREGDVGTFRVESGNRKEGTIEEGIAHLAVKNGFGVVELTRERATLEDVFRSLTLAASKASGHA